ncbi:MAG: hypothetical protein EOP11_08320 [Proteobacteria bacterium]|nr:MAG: hypothetical protein EOP11_08320 [Pseudomonadota bacterium]
MLPLLETVLFTGTLFLAFFVFRGMGRTLPDGWSYAKTEERWLLSGLLAFLLLSRERSLAAVPTLWPASFHEMAALSSLLVATYALHGILSRASFRDQLCVDRGAPRPVAGPPYHLAALSLLAGLFILASGHPGRAELSFGTLALPLCITLYRAVKFTEWKRIRKRSTLASIYYFYGLLAFTSAMILLPLFSWLGLVSFQAPAITLSAACLSLSVLRERAFARRMRRARALVEECRQELNLHAAAQPRLQALCGFVESEWGAVRVSLISVNANMGLVIASDGPDALPMEGRAEPRRLGPFLRRVCREGHILYAPMAEELGHEFQAQGLKHSSLAVPFRQEGSIRAVLCVMAEEGERIPPGEGLILETFARELGLEILSATAQFVAEERAAKLYALAKQSDSIAVEHMDNWGYLHLPNAGEVRFLVGAKVEPAAGLSRHPSPLLQQVHAAYAGELKNLWRSLALAFEFVPRESQGVLWMVSPREFQNPFLHALGPERASLALCQLLAKLSLQQAEKDSFLLLGGTVPRIAAGPVEVRADRTAPGGIDLDNSNREALLRLLLAGDAGAPRWAGQDPAALAARGFSARSSHSERLSGQDFFSLLSLSADKKELRRLEQRAAEAAREIRKDSRVKNLSAS